MSRVVSRFVVQCVVGAAAFVAAVTGGTAFAQSTYYWTGTSGSYALGGTGTWNAGTPWRISGTSGTLSSYTSGTNAVFFSGTGGTLSIASGTVQVNRINVASTATGTYTIGSGTLQFVGGTNGITMAPGKTLVITPNVQQGTGAGTLDIVGGGTVQFGATNRSYAGNLQVSGTGTTLKYVATNGLDNGSASSGVTAFNGGTAEINSTNNMRTTMALGVSGSSGGTFKLGNSAALVTQSGFNLSVSGTSKSTVLSTLSNTTTTSGSYGAISGNGGSNGTFTVGATGDASGVDLEYSAVFRNGTLAKSGSGTMRLSPGFMITQTGSSDLSTYVATGVSVNVNAGALLNEGTIYSIANVNGGLLKTTGTAGAFDQVNVTSGTFEISRSSGLFRTLTPSGTTYASGNNALNPRGGTIRYVGVSTDYSGQMGSLGGVASTIDTNGQTVTFASALSGTGGLTKAGGGTLTLSTTNGHSGVTAVTGGTLALDSPLGLQNSPFSTSGAGVLQLPSAATAITLGGLAGTNAVAPVNYSTVTALTLNPQAGVTATLSGPLGDGAAGMTVTKTGSGTQVFSGTTSYTGITTVTAGTLRFATTASLYGGGTSNWTAANLVTGSGATTAFSVGGAGEFVEADITTLAALGSATDGFLAGSTLGLDTSNAGGSWTYAGSIANPNAGVNTLGLVKLGSGTLALTAVQAYTGPTTVTAGALLLDAVSSLATSSGVTVSGGSLRLGGDSVLGGIPLTLAGGGVSSADGSARTISSNVTVTGNVTLGDATANGPITFSGPMDLGGQFRTFTMASDATITGTITNGGIAKTGTGVLALAGVNTYSGTTRVNDGGGVLRIDAASALPAASVIASVKTGTNTGSLVLNTSGTNTFTNAFANFSSSNGLANGGTPNIQNLQGSNTVSGNMTITAGGGNGVNLTSDGGLLTISGTLQNNGGSGTRPFFLGGTGNGIVSGAVVTGAISGSNATSIIKTGSGTWSLSNTANSFGAGVSILDGILDVASLADTGVASATGTAGTISFIGQGTSGALRYTGATSQSTNRTVSIGASGGAIDSSGSAPLTFTGSFAAASPASFNLIYTASSNVAVNTNSSAPDVVVGMTVTSTSSVLPAGTTITAINGNVYTLSASALTSSTTSASFSNVARTLVLKGSNTGTNTFASRLIDNSGTAVLAITKQGTGTWILTGSNTYTGPTIISGGTLLVNGNQAAATGSVLVDALATLGGSGTAGGAVTVAAGGLLAPGASIGALVTGSSLTFADGSTYAFELNTATVTADLLAVSGSFSLPTSGTASLTLTDLGTPNSLPLDTVFTLVNYQGGWNGGLFAFGGGLLGEGGTFTSGSNTWRITYTGTAGGVNTTSLPGSFVNITVVPEPSALPLLGGVALGGLAVMRRRSRRRVGGGVAAAGLVAIMAAGAGGTAEAQLTYYWGGASGTYAVGGPGTWNSSAVNQWRFADPVTGSLMVYSNGTNAVFFSGTGGTLSIASGTVQVNRINVASTATGTYTIGSGTLQFVGGTNGITMAPGKTLVITPNVQQGSGAGTLEIVGGGTVQFGATNRAYAGNLLVTGTGTTLKYVATNGLDNGSVSSGITVSNGGTAEINSTNNYRTTFALGTSGSSGGTLKLGFAGGNGALVAQSGFNLSVSGTSKSIVLSTANNTTTTSGSYAAIGGNGSASNGTFTVGSTGDASGIDLEYSAVFRNGTLVKTGSGTMRLNSGFMITQTGSSDLSTYVATGTSVNVNAGTLLNQGTIYSIANVNGGLLKTSGTSGSFDQVNVTSGTFEISRASGLFRTLSGTTYASGNGGLNPRGGTIRYAGVSTDYSGQMGSLGGVASTIDTNGQTVAFASTLSGTGGLTKAGGGALTLSAANTYSGVTTVTGGTLVINHSLALQNSRLDTSGAGATQIAGTVIGGLSIGGLSGGGDIGLGSANVNALTLNLASGTATYSANLGSAIPGMSLTKTGSGLQVLSGTAGYTGPISITGGGLYFTTAAALYNASSGAWTAANLITGSGGTLAINVGGTGELTVGDAATIAALGSATDGFLPGSTLGLGVTDPLSTVSYTTALADPNGGANSRGFVKLGAGTLSLTAPATYTGSTTVAGGRLVFEATSALPTTAGVSLTGSGAALDVSAVPGTSLTLPALSIAAGGTVALGGKSLSFGTVGTNTIAGGVISGTGGIAYTGAGILDLSGSNTFTGFTDGISLAAGSTVYLKNPYGLGDASAGTTLGDGATIYILSPANSAPIPEPFTISGTGAQLRAGSAIAYTLTGSIALPSAVTMNLDGNATITAGGPISGTAGIVKTGGGTLVLSNSTGVNTFAGGITQTSAGGITIGAAGSQGSGPITFGAGGSGAITFATVSGTITNAILSVDGGSGGITKSGESTMVLVTANTYTGTTTVANAGGTLRIDAVASLPAASVINLPKSGTSTGSLVLNTAGTNTYANTFANFASSNGLPNGGTPNIRNLQGDNTVSGNLTITAGGGNGVNLTSDGGLLTIAGTLQNNGASTPRPFFLGGSGNGVVSGAIVTGAISGSNGTSIIKNGPGTWSLTNTANSFGSGVSVLDGVLDVVSLADTGVASATGTAGTISFVGQGTSGVLRYTGATAQSTNRPVSIGASGGAIDSSGDGSLTFTGSFSSVGPTSFNLTYTAGSAIAYNLNSATPDVVVGMAVTTSTSVLPAGTTITAINGNAYTLSSQALSGTAASASFSTVERTLVLKGSNGGDNTIAGRLVDSGSGGRLSVAKQGSGKWVLSGSNGYTGVTSVTAGTLALAPTASIGGSSRIAVAAGAVLDVSALASGLVLGGSQTLVGSGTVAGSATISANATLSPGASPGTLSLTGDLTWNSAGNYNWQMLSGTGTAGSLGSWDEVSVTGTLAIASTSADPFRINLWTLSGISPDVSGSAANFNSASNYAWTIATAAGGISGFAADKFTVVTSATNGTGGFANAFGTGTFSVAQSGNAIQLVFTAGAAPSVITINVPSGTQTQAQAGYPTLSGSIPVVKTGGGTLVLDQANTLSGSTTVQGGVLQLANGAALSSSRLVVVAGGTGQVAPVTTTGVASLDLATGNGLLDLTSGGLTISGGMTATDLVAEILEGRADGTWTGTSGITSSVAATAVASSIPRAVGWVDNGDGSLTAAYAAPGDTNIDWSIDILDASNFLALGKFDTGLPATWIEGDFSYDGIVDILDAADFFATGLYDGGNYNLAAGTDATPDGVGLGQSAGGVAAVPEPAMAWLTLGAVCSIGCMARWWRRRVYPTAHGLGTLL